MTPSLRRAVMHAAAGAVTLAAAVWLTAPTATTAVAPTTTRATAPIGTLPAAPTTTTTTLAPPTTAAPTTTPPTLVAPGQGCPEWEYLLAAHQPTVGWDVAAMSRIMFRESSCRPAAQSSSHDTGLLQINEVNWPYLEDVLGVQVDATTLTDPVLNVAAAAALCAYWADVSGDCLAPWAATR